MKKQKEPTSTALVYETLVKADDFMTVRQLMAVNDLSNNRVTAALYLLRKYKAADFVVEDGARLFWFATPDTDQRTRTVKERTPEVKPRKQRQAKKKIL